MCHLSRGAAPTSKIAARWVALWRDWAILSRWGAGTREGCSSRFRAMETLEGLSAQGLSFHTRYVVRSFLW